VWLRCAHCAAGFDICQEAEQMADHDSTHGTSAGLAIHAYGYS
jgi:hypothetical protein